MMALLGFTKIAVTYYHPQVINGVPQLSWGFFILFLVGAAVVLGAVFAFTAYASWAPGDIIDTIGGGVCGFVVGWALCYGLIHGLLLATGVDSTMATTINNSLLGPQLYYFELFKAFSSEAKQLGNYGN